MPSGISAILLAAGKSRRMGRSKPLLPLGDRPLVRHCLDALLDGGVGDLYLVIGTCGDAVAEAALDLPVTVVRNPDPDGDMAGSVRCALQSIPADRQGILISLVDHPLVTAGTIVTLCLEHARQPDKIIVPTYLGRRGHPTLFPRSVLAELEATATLRDIVNLDSDRVLYIPVEDDGTLLDLDTPEEYCRAVDLVRDAAALSPERSTVY